MKQYYDVLSIPEGSTLAEVKKASRKLLLKYHPDLHPHNQAWAQEKTRIILNAYSTLCDYLADEQITFRTTEDLANRPPAPPRIETVPVMAFSLGSLLFAVTIPNVKQITMLQGLKVIKITNRKGLYPFIKGIIHYQGTIAPLLDLGDKLNIEALSSRQQVLICEIEQQPLAMIIDEGKNVLSIGMNDFNNHLYRQDSEIALEYVSNVIMNNGQKIHILDLGKLLTH